MKHKITTHTDLATFAAHAHEVGPLAVLREMINNGTPALHAVLAVEQLFGDMPEFCPHCHQEIIDDE